MKLLVSDYDGTLKTNEKNLKINLLTLKEFMEKGNLFCIATGRSFSSVKNEVNKYNIPYDYLICNNGLTIFNKNDKLIYYECLNDDKITIFKNEIIKYDYPYQTFNLYGNVDNKNIVYIDIHHNSLFRKYLLEKDIIKWLNNISLYNLNGHLYVENVIDKAVGINKLILLENLDIDYDDIYTVGDSSNDIEMLQEFNGSKVDFHYPCLYGKGINNCGQVHKLVKKLMK